MKLELGTKTLFFLSGSVFIIAGLGSLYNFLLFWGVLFILISIALIIWEK